MKGSKTRKKLFFTCMLFMFVFMTLFVVALHLVTNSAYFEAYAEAETREMHQLYDIYLDLRSYYNNSISYFATAEYINSDIAEAFNQIQYESNDISEASMEELAINFADYISNMDIFIVNDSNIICLYTEEGNPQAEAKEYIQDKSIDFMTEDEALKLLSINGLYKEEIKYESSHIIIEKLKYYENISIIAIPRYDRIFDFTSNKIVIYNRNDEEELRLNTDSPGRNLIYNSSVGNENYKTYGLGEDRYMLCYYSNEDERGDYCIGVVSELDLNYRYILYIFLLLLLIVVSYGMWIWSERITKPLDFFLMWIKLIKDKGILEKGENADTPMPKENYLLQNNIMLFFSFCLIPIVFIGAVQWYTENQLINGYIEQRYVQSAEFYGNILDEQYDIWRNPVTLLCNDDRIEQSLQDYKNGIDIDYDRIFIQYLHEYSKVFYYESNKFTVYDTEGKVVFSYFNDLENDRYIKYRVNINEVYKWSFADGLDTFVLHQKIYDDAGTIVGYCSLELDSPNLHKNTVYTGENLYSCYMYKYTDKIFNLLGSPSLTDEKVISMIRNSEEYPLAKSIELEKANVNYFYIIKDKVFFDRIWDKYTVTFINIALFIGIALIFAASILTRATLNPIIHISNALYTDSPQVPMSTMLLGKEEFALIVNRVKTLSDQVNEYAKEQKLLEAERHEQEKKRKDAEILTLQTQINPHFMYNIFSSIAVLIRTGQTEKATKMVMYTGNLMRMGLYRGHVMIPLKEEIEHVSQYVKIQQIRYNSCMEFDVNIDESLMHLRVVKFILQPIVENAIEHNVGYLEERKLQISINAFKQDKVLVVQIVDNGRGIDGEKINKLQESINNFDMSSHLGLANINERIKLNCGNRYGVVLNNNEDEGLKVELVLPIVVEKEDVDV